MEKELDEILKYIGMSGPATEHDKKALLEWRDKALAEANRVGHWFVGEEKLDAYYHMAYHCNCGYKENNRDAIDSHVDWKKTELMAFHQSKDAA